MVSPWRRATIAIIASISGLPAGAYEMVMQGVLLDPVMHFLRFGKAEVGG